jgi:anti-sigma factor RsiW
MSAYLDGELTSAARARMERHSGECPDCRGTLEGLRRMLDMLERLPRAGAGAASPKIATAVQRRLHEPPAR